MRQTMTYVAQNAFRKSCGGWVATMVARKDVPDTIRY